MKIAQCNCNFAFVFSRININSFIVYKVMFRIVGAILSPIMLENASNSLLGDGSITETVMRQSSHECS